ncbi:hypothetical protein D3C71_20810 [compost metagenome]
MKVIGNFQACDLNLRILATTYATGHIAFAIETEEGEPCGCLSVNVPDVVLEPGEFIAKTWAENEPLREPALATGLFQDTGKRIEVGFCEGEIWRQVQVH